MKLVMKNFLLLTVMVLLSAIFIACSGTSDSSETAGGGINVTFINGAETLQTADVSEGYAFGAALPVPGEDPSGSVFIGWSTLAGGSVTNFDANTAVTSDTVLYAVWAVGLIREVTFMDGASSFLESKAANGASYGAALPVLPNTSELEFIGWNTSGGSTANFTGTNVIAKDTVLYAVWASAAGKLRSVKFYSEDGFDFIQELSVEHGSALGARLPAITGDDPQGRHFIGWSMLPGSGQATFFADTSVTGDISLYAVWSYLDVDEYYVIFLDTDGTALEERVYHRSEPLDELPVPGDMHGYDFLGWSNTSSSENWLLSGVDGYVNITGDMVVTRNHIFRQVYYYKTYTVTFMDSDRTTELATRSNFYNMTVGVPVLPTRVDVEFVRWEFEDGTEFNEFTHITDNFIVYAVWELRPGHFIYNASEFVQSTFDGDPSGEYTLVNDITLENHAAIEGFTGILNGNGKTVTVKSFAPGANMGLFGTLNGGLLHNLTVDMENIELTLNTRGTNRVGSLVAYNNGGTIEDVKVTGKLTVTANPQGTSGNVWVYAGGLVGQTDSNTANIRRVSSSADIEITRASTAAGYQSVCRRDSRENASHIAVLL
jgi:hypothetical protein